MPVSQTGAPPPSRSAMHAEALEAPAAAARLLAAEGQRFASLGAALRADAPRTLLTVARGSSDHAAHYLAYLIMARLGRVVASLPMSVVTLYQSSLQCESLAAFALSQSGQSPDLVAPMRYLHERGARTVAFVNDAASPLAAAVAHVVPLHAGAETSVAATKSCLAQLVASAALVAAWQQDAGFEAGVAALPDAMQRAAAADWSAGVEPLRHAEQLYVIGRGTGLPAAMEAALKFKETCGIHAEAFSGAELRHGPMALVDSGFPLLVFAPPGPAQPGLLALADELRGRGALVLLAAPAGTPGAALPLVTSALPDLDPILALQSFYPMVEALARARGLDPDRPRHLSKVTRTR